MSVINLALSVIYIGPGLSLNGSTLSAGFSTGIASITADPTTGALELVNDEGTPGDNMVYGTNSYGAKGWYSAVTQSVSFPIGTIAASAQDGGTWLQMNGQIVSQTTYPTLFTTIGHQPQFTWTAAIPPSAISSSPVAIAYGNSTYVLTTNTSSSSSNIYTSSDAINWTARNGGTATVDGINVITWNSTNQVFIAAGQGTGGTVYIATSPDGINWTTKVNNFTSIGITSILTNGGTTIIGNTTTVWYSTDGVNFSQATVSGSPTSTTPIAVYYNSTYFLCPLGAFSTGITYSTNGTSWTYVAKPTTGNAVYIGTYGGYFWLLDDLTGIVWYSATGATWTQGSNPGWVVGANAPTILAQFSSGVIALGSVAGTTGYTSNGFTSFSGFSVRPPMSLNAGIVLAQPFNNSSQKFALVAINNVGVYISVDGINWVMDAKVPSLPTTFVSNGQYTSRYLNGRYFVLGGAGGFTVLSAPDPYNPSTQFQIPTSAPAGTILYIKAA